MAGARVLVVDDDPGILTSLERGLRLGGFDVSTVDSGAAALDAVAALRPDAIVLDVWMSDLSGVEVCRRLRSDGLDVPVCMLSALDDVEDRLAGLRAGADDYLVKPFSLEELRLRLLALLRRGAAGRAPAEAIVAGPLRVEPAGRRVLLDGREIELTRREFDLLEVLTRHRGVVLTRERLLAEVWGYDFATSTNVVDVFVGYLRRKTEDGDRPRLVHTVRGVGFVLRS